MSLQLFQAFCRPWVHPAFALLLATAPVPADEAETGEDTRRHVAVRVVEGEVAVLKGGEEEALTRGVPLTEGDVVESRGRGILQLADGTRLAFDTNTRFEIASLFSEGDAEPEVLLRMDWGRLKIAVDEDGQAEVRVDNPWGSVGVPPGAEATVWIDPEAGTQVWAYTGRISFQGERDEADLRSGETLAVSDPRESYLRVQRFNTSAWEPFELWCRQAVPSRETRGLNRMPAELQPYAGDLDGHGEWIWVNEHQTWCWRPARVSSEWRPYWQGRWAAYPEGMTWISDEPWGYVTYHHGRWGWRPGFGWFWIPGIRYAPAWVVWQSTETHFAWAPMGHHGAAVVWGSSTWAPTWHIVEFRFVFVPQIHRHLVHHPQASEGFRGDAHRERIVITRHESRDPHRMQQVLCDRSLIQERNRSPRIATWATEHRRIESRETRDTAPAWVLASPPRKHRREPARTAPVGTFIRQEDRETREIPRQGLWIEQGREKKRQDGHRDRGSSDSGPTHHREVITSRKAEGTLFLESSRARSRNDRESRSSASPTIVIQKRKKKH